jgi:aspartate/tyrosine/aromatic aminotransferase
MSSFADVQECPPDPIFGVTQYYNASTHPSKALLTVGVYRDADNLPYTFPSVYKAEARIVHRFGHEYLPMAGHPSFLTHARRLLWSDSLLHEIGNRITTVQSCGGTGSLYLASRFAERFLKVPKVLVSDPFWPVYVSIFQDNHHTLSKYPYLKDWSFDCNGALDALENEVNGCFVVLQVCAHNPTGIDPSQEDWRQLLECCLRKKHMVCFDFAYMGFASGDMDSDAWPVREYARLGGECFVAFSFSKCMGLYGERIGALHVVCSDAEKMQAIQGQLLRIARATWTVGPQNGAHLVSEILSDEELESQWRSEVELAGKRVIEIRNKLCDLLKTKTGHEWKQIRKANGLFAYTGFNPEQVKRLADEFGVFLIETGRITIPALNPMNVEYIAHAIAEVSGMMRD